jgi:diaminopimelate decarboxylase
VQHDNLIRINDKGHLEIENIDSVNLAREYDTPLFIISENTIRSNYQRFTKAFSYLYPKHVVCFSYKSNNGLSVRRILQQEGAGAQCHSYGELYIALLLGVDPSKIIIDGIYKTVQEIDVALETGSFIVIDNLVDLRNILNRSKRLEKTPKALLKIRTKYTSVNKKNGMDLETAYQAFKILLAEKIPVWGLEVHGKSQANIETFESDLEEMLNFSGKLHKEFNWEPKIIDLGTGFPVSRKEGYGPEGAEKIFPPIESFAKAIIEKLWEKLDEHKISEPILFFEPGRYMVANAGVLLGRVGLVKQLPIPGWTKKVCLDISFNLLMRLATDKYYFHIISANKAGYSEEEVVDIVGPTGYGGFPDDLGKARYLPKLEDGDLVAVLDAGAYCESTTTQYLSYPRPPTVLVSGDQVDLVRSRETVHDLIIRDIIPKRLMSLKRGSV